jgi:hypothetical protein
MFNSILTTVTTSMTVAEAVGCTAASLILGLVIALVYMKSSKNYSKNYILTLVLLPALVQVVIMMVNGNLGTGVAVMGAFSLVRFRSIPGTSKEICGIFFAMITGLATGMGYIGYAAIFTLIISLAMFVISRTNFGEAKDLDKDLRVTIPESLEYNGFIDDLFEKYTQQHQLSFVKTTNMGSMYELQYKIRLKNEAKEQELMNAIRCRNGNLTVSMGRKPGRSEEL